MIRAVLVLLIVAFPTLSVSQSEKRALKPEIRVGDSWTYRSTGFLSPGTDQHETRVTFADDNVILAVSTRRSDGKEFDSSWTSEWNAISSYVGWVYHPPTGILKFPLRVGDKHSIKFDVVRTRESTVTFHATGMARVSGWEWIEVPAGRFHAIKVEVEAVYQRLDDSSTDLRNFTYWYDPEVRRWVKLHAVTPNGESGEELLEYKLNEN
jgi:hypothetical protein